MLEKSNIRRGLWKQKIVKSKKTLEGVVKQFVIVFNNHFNLVAEIILLEVQKVIKLNR